jgi:hygromycin-B 7''-O-kinase
MGRADVYLQPDAADPVLPAELVLGLARTHLPDRVRLGGLRAVDESGGEARVYLFDGDVVVKTQRPHRLRPRTSLAKEAALLTALAEPLGGRIPVLFGYDQVVDPEAGAVEFLVMGRVRGRAVRHVEIPAATRAALLGEVGRVLRTVHALDIAAAGCAELIPTDGDAARLRRRLELGLADVVEELSAHPAGWTLPLSPAEVAARAVAVLPAELTAGPVVLHSNPGPTHVFIDPGGRFTGLIDFGDAYRSHPALDLRAWPDPADRLLLREAYLDGARADAEFDTVWTVAMIYADLTAVARHPGLAGRAVDDLAERLGVL